MTAESTSIRFQSVEDCPPLPSRYRHLLSAKVDVVKHRREAVELAAFGSRCIAIDGAVANRQQVIIVVVGKPAAIGRRVAANGRAGDRHPVPVVDAAALLRRRIARECAAGDVDRATRVREAAAPFGRVAAECAAADRLGAVAVVEAAAVLGGGIAGEGAAAHRRRRLMQVDACRRRTCWPNCC